MKAGVEQAFVMGELLVRTGRYLVVLTLPLVCWLVGQGYPAQALIAWAVQRGTRLLATRRTAARARVSFDTTAFTGDVLYEINRIHTR
jgi:hypothetical protein